MPKIATCLVATLFSIGAMMVLVGGSASAAPDAPSAPAAVAQASSSMSSMSSQSSMSSISSQSSQSVAPSSSSSSTSANRALATTGTGLGFPLMIGSAGVLLAIAARAFLRARAVV